MSLPKLNLHNQVDSGIQMSAHILIIGYFDNRVLSNKGSCSRCQKLQQDGQPCQ